MHPAPPAQTLDFAAALVHPLCQKLKNQTIHSLHELLKKPGALRADAIRFDIEPHTSVFPQGCIITFIMFLGLHGQKC